MRTNPEDFLSDGNNNLGGDWNFHIEWALRYERDGDPTMDNPSGVTTQTSVVANEDIARAAVRNHIPGGSGSSIRDRRVAWRFVTDWVDLP